MYIDYSPLIDLHVLKSSISGFFFFWFILCTIYIPFSEKSRFLLHIKTSAFQTHIGYMKGPPIHSITSDPSHVGLKKWKRTFSFP